MTMPRRTRPTAHTGREIARKLTTDRSYLQALRQRIAARRAVWGRAMHGDAAALIELGRLVLDQGTDDEDEYRPKEERR